MNFKDHFVTTLKSNYSEEVKLKVDTEEAKKHAVQLIEEYFNDLYNNLCDVSQVSSLNFYEDVRIGMEYRKNCFVSFPFNLKQLKQGLLRDSFKVTLGKFGMVEEDILTIENNRFRSEKFKMDLSEELLDTYLQYVFEKAIDKE